MELEIKKIDVSYSQYEAASVIESIHDALFRKVRWTISPAYDAWHQLDFDVVRAAVDSLSTAYMQLYLAFRQSVEDSYDSIDPEFEKAFIIGQEAWEVIDQIRESKTWDDVERHLHGETLCRACREINRIPKA